MHSSLIINMDPTAIKKFAVCVFYGLASCSLSFINKSLFNVYNYKFPNMPEGIPKLWAVPKYSLKIAKECSVLSLTFLGNVMAGVGALSKVNIPVFLAFRRLTTLFIFTADVFYLKKKVHPFETIGVCCITLGALLAGYFLIMVNNFMTTLHFNVIKKHSEYYPHIDSATSSFYMSTLSIPILLVFAQFERPEAFDLFDRSFEFYFIFFISLAAGIWLTFSQNLCTVVNSPIITSITGNVKDILLTFVSLLIFDDVVPSFWLVVGLIISLAGAFIYSYPKLEEQMNPKKTKE